MADVSSPNTPEKFEWRQSSPGKVVDPAPMEPSSKKKTNKKSLRRRISSAFRSKEEKKRKKMEKMRKAYEEDTLSSIPEEAKEDDDGPGATDNEAKSLHINIEDWNKVKMGSPVSQRESVIQKKGRYYWALQIRQFGFETFKIQIRIG